MQDMIITKCPLRPTLRTLGVLTEKVRVTSMWGAGELVHVTADGWAGVRLDGEKGVYEYPAEHVFTADAATSVAELAAEVAS